MADIFDGTLFHSDNAASPFQDLRRRLVIDMSAPLGIIVFRVHVAFRL
jgi:hypothetical protein